MEVGGGRIRRDADQDAGDERDQCLVDLRCRLAARGADGANGERPGDGEPTGAGPRAEDRARHKARDRAGEEPASRVNKALVAFIACMLVGVAAFSASANLHRFAK